MVKILSLCNWSREIFKNPEKTDVQWVFNRRDQDINICFLILGDVFDVVLSIFFPVSESFCVHFKVVVNMTTPSTQFAPSSRLGLYEPLHQISMWEDTFDGNISPGSGVCMITEVDSKIDDKVTRCRAFRLTTVFLADDDNNNSLMMVWFWIPDWVWLW